ncbi:hypothetical protein [Acidobacterium sp. S8]|uniref:hypothetical protein n=1 Tax=Acidobacterium sp. S8 TaxID=1641854 RepID=UPI00131D791B|nr:hypothetical protein [Acidobacterium sp. S8]
MTTEQLQAARAEKWRQKANPILTIEDAETWIDSTGVSLFLPRKTQIQSPAPSFTEAIHGETNATPPPAAIQTAFEMARRLLADQKATPLNLLGTASEQPDFLASVEALPYVFALRGDRDWKRGPRDKSSPLVVETWKLLKREGALTAIELQNLLGREVTEAAVLRALGELWGAFRVLPIYTEGEDTAWELFESRHQKAMQSGGGMAQATALSALISLYLDTVIAATSDEIETFLSPLAPRSRIREVVSGLTTTRQLLTIALGTQSLLHIAGGLPEFPEIEAAPETAAAAESADAAPRERRPFTPRRTEDRGPRRERPAFGDRPAARKPAAGGWKRPGSAGPRREWTPRPAEKEGSESRPRRTAAGEGFRKPFRPRTGESAGAPRKEWKPRREGEGPREFPPRRQAGQGGGFKKPYRSRTEGAGFERREGGSSEGRREFKPRPSGGFRPRREEGSEGAKKPFGNRTGDRRPGSKFVSREGGAARPPRKDWKPRREGEERSEFRPRRAEGGEGARRSFGKPAGDRKPAGRSFSRERGPAGPRKEWKPRREGEERSEFRPRRTEGGEGARKPFGKPTGDRKPAGKSFSRERGPAGPRKEWKPRREGEEHREFRPRRAEGDATERRPFKPRPAGGSFRPRREEGAPGDRPKFGAKRPATREGFDRKKPPQRERAAGEGAERPKKSFSRPASQGGKSFGFKKSTGKKSSFGGKRPGGKRPNNRKGKKSGE